MMAEAAMKGVVLQKFGSRSQQPDRSKVASSPAMVMRTWMRGGASPGWIGSSVSLALVDAVGQSGDRLTHLGFGEVVQAVQCTQKGLGAVRLAEILQAPGCDGGGGDLAEQIALGGDRVAGR